MDAFEKNFEKVCKELEKLNETFVIKGIPKEYAGVWTPKNEIKLWSVGRTSAQILKSFALAKKPKITLELGTSAGYSTIWLASATRQFGGQIYTIEMARPKIEMAAKYFKKTKLDKYIVQIDGRISDVLKKWNKKLDFVFLDADKKNYLNYIKNIEPFLNKGAIVIADNACNYGYLMKDYLNYVSKSKKYYSFLLNIDHGLMISIKL